MSIGSELRDKPILTIGELLRIQGKRPTQSVDYKLYKNKQGQVIGVKDPFTQESYRIKPTSVVSVKRSFTGRQLARELAQKEAITEAFKQRPPVKMMSEYKPPEPTVLSKVTGLAKLGNMATSLRNELRSKRTKQRAKGETYEKLAFTSLKLWGITAFTSLVETGQGYTDLPETAFLVVKNPSILKEFLVS